MEVRYYPRFQAGGTARGALSVELRGEILTVVSTASQRIKGLIEVSFAEVVEDLDEDDELLGNENLHFLGVVRLIVLVKREFKITVSDEELVPEHFKTIGRLAFFVQVKLGSS